MDSFVDVAEVEVGDGRSASPIKIDTGAAIAARLKASANNAAAATIAAANGTIVQPSGGGGEFHICRICNQFVPVTDIAEHNSEHHGAVSDLTCLDCGKIFKSKRSLFGHRKEKHSGVTEVHSCPECGKTFGRKSNLKAHREFHCQQEIKQAQINLLQVKGVEYEDKEPGEEVEIPLPKKSHKHMENVVVDDNINGAGAMEVDIKQEERIVESFKTTDWSRAERSRHRDEDISSLQQELNKCAKQAKNEGKYACDTVGCGYRTKKLWNLKAHCERKSHQSFHLTKTSI